MPSLLNKLRMLDAEPKKPMQTPAADASRPCSFHHTHAIFPLSLFSEQTYATPELLQTVFGCAFPEKVQPEDVLFLDTETTGLSGGVGTVAFQIGVGYFNHNGFVVEQFLMHDYPEEASMLRALNALMQRFSVLCTFNGRTFDVPLLRSRFLMNRIADANFPQAHADVLYPARRLWKLRLKSCTLGHLEEQLLHVQREDDLPGALVPQTYFQYLKDGNFEPLQRILEHNKQDIVSLAQLFYYLCKQVARPQEIMHGEDLFSLARSLEKAGNTEQAMRCYRISAQSCMHNAACQALARMEKRSGNAEAAVKLYQAMLKHGGDDAAACEALAKLYEHQLRDLPSALSYTRKALLLLSEPNLFQSEAAQQQRIALQQRYSRLRKKLAKQPVP